jgi:hypothetical protein
MPPANQAAAEAVEPGTMRQDDHLLITHDPAREKYKLILTKNIKSAILNLRRTGP